MCVEGFTPRVTRHTASHRTHNSPHILAKLIAFGNSGCLGNLLAFLALLVALLAFLSDAKNPISNRLRGSGPVSNLPTPMPTAPETDLGAICQAVVTATDPLNVRARPTTAAERIGMLNPNEMIQVKQYQMVEGYVWFQIIHRGDNSGWSAGAYITLQNTPACKAVCPRCF